MWEWFGFTALMLAGVFMLLALIMFFTGPKKHWDSELTDEDIQDIEDYKEQSK